MSYDFQMPPLTGPLHIRKQARREMGEVIERMSEETGYKFGPRGWAYYAEGLGLITKGEFDRFTKLLVDMRKDGELDPDVIEPDASRLATVVDDFEATDGTPEQLAQHAINEFIPASHPDDIMARNEPAKELVRDNIARLIRDWSFD
jgi:hypothetical protein